MYCTVYRTVQHRIRAVARISGQGQQKPMWGQDSLSFVEWFFSGGGQNCTRKGPPAPPWLRLCTVLYLTVLCCAVLCCAVLCCAVLCCAVLCCAVLCCIALRFALLYFTLLMYCAVLCCMCCAVQHFLSVKNFFFAFSTYMLFRHWIGCDDLNLSSEDFKNTSEMACQNIANSVKCEVRCQVGYNAVFPNFLNLQCYDNKWIRKNNIGKYVRLPNENAPPRCYSKLSESF
jgi:hypothetical protein